MPALLVNSGTGIKAATHRALIPAKMISKWKRWINLKTANDAKHGRKLMPAIHKRDQVPFSVA
jgi:hypothetical protein